MSSVDKRYSTAYSKLLSNQYFSRHRINQAKDFQLLAELIPDVKNIVVDPSKTAIRCYCISDLHADTTKNQQWVEDNCCRLTTKVTNHNHSEVVDSSDDDSMNNNEDIINGNKGGVVNNNHDDDDRDDDDDDAYTVIILPGDVGSEVDRIEMVFKHLVNNYDAVCYVPGNHEAWRRGILAGGPAILASDPSIPRPSNRMACDSIVKLKEVLECALRCGVHIGPIRIQLMDTNTTNTNNNDQDVNDKDNHDQDDYQRNEVNDIDVDHDHGIIVSIKDNSSNEEDNRRLDDNVLRTSISHDRRGQSVEGMMSTLDHDHHNHNHHHSNRKGVLIMPLYSWYHKSWDIEPSVNDAQYLAVEKVAPFNRRWGDFSLCSWPTDVIDHDDFINNVKNNTVLAEAFAKLNEKFLYPPAILLHENDQSNHIYDHDDDHHYDSTADNGCNEKMEQLSSQSSPSSPTKTTSSPTTISTSSSSTTTSTTPTAHHNPIFRSPITHHHPDDFIISFSHFLPRIECCPEKRFLIDPALSTVIGSDPLGTQVTRLQPDIHLYGHTHIPMDVTLDGIRYIQWPLGYYRESTLQCKPVFNEGPLLLLDTRKVRDFHDNDNNNNIDNNNYQANNNKMITQRELYIPERLPSEDTIWSVYYRQHERDVTKTNDLALWVRRKLDSFEGLVDSSNRYNIGSS